MGTIRMILLCICEKMRENFVYLRLFRTIVAVMLNLHDVLFISFSLHGLNNLKSTKSTKPTQNVQI